MLPTFPISSPPLVDLDNDNRAEILQLTGDRLSIISEQETAWQSPEAWRVTQAGFTDLNRDDLYEVTLLVWRAFAPWPVDRWLPYGGRIKDFHDPDGLSCHLILIGWDGGRYRELWAGSALAEPVLEFSVADLDSDGRQELLTLEGRYTDRPAQPASAFKVWEWNGFGFTVVDSLSGAFLHMQPVQSPSGQAQIILQTILISERSTP